MASMCRTIKRNMWFGKGRYLINFKKHNWYNETETEPKQIKLSWFKNILNKIKQLIF